MIIDVTDANLDELTQLFPGVTLTEGVSVQIVFDMTRAKVVASACVRVTAGEGGDAGEDFEVPIPAALSALSGELGFENHETGTINLTASMPEGGDLDRTRHPPLPCFKVLLVGFFAPLSSF